jgi:hypothetical protein
MASNEGAGGQVEDQTAIHLLVEVEVEVVDGCLRVAKLSLLGPALQQAIAATSELVRDQAGEEVDGWHGFGLRLAETSFEHGGNPPSRSCRKARFNSMRFILLAPGF